MHEKQKRREQYKQTKKQEPRAINFTQSHVKQLILIFLSHFGGENRTANIEKSHSANSVETLNFDLGVFSETFKQFFSQIATRHRQFRFFHISMIHQEESARSSLIKYVNGNSKEKKTIF